jgi:PIN domain nuclease of toxin-antitoxin system
MATTKVLDSYALLAFFEDEPGADSVRGLIMRAEEKNNNLLMSVLSLGEVWGSIAKTGSAETADSYINEIRGMAIEVVDIDWQIARQAAVFTGITGLSFADCIPAALAKVRKAELITGHKNFKSLENQIKITWL